MATTQPGRRRLSWRAVRWLGVLAVAVLAPVAIASQDGPRVDAVLLLDSSGSMKHTDPDRLRVPAAKLFLSLLGNGDRGAVMSFSQKGWTLAGPSDLGQARARQRLLASVEKVTSKGTWTNLYTALSAARERLPEDSGGRERYIVLLSDGRMDVGDRQRDAALKTRLRDELLPRLREAGTHVYTVAFSEGSDTALLREIAERTDGLFRLVEDNAHLHDAFASVFENAKEPDMLPIEAGEFMVDDSVNDVTVVASKATSDAAITLVTPDGKRLDAATNGPAVRWFTSPRFDMITLSDPATGTWRVRSSDGGDRAYIATDLGLSVVLDADEPQAGQETPIRAWLERGGKRVSRYEILVNTQFEARITGPDGSPRQVTLTDDGDGGDATAGDGVFSARITPAAGGTHELAVIAESTTFERRRTRHLQVAAPPAPDPAPAPAPEPEPEPEPAAKKPAAKPEAADSNHIDVWPVVIAFLAVNVVVVAAGGATLWLLRRRQAGDGGDAAAEPAEEAA